MEERMKSSKVFVVLVLAAMFLSACGAAAPLVRSEFSKTGNSQEMALPAPMMEADSAALAPSAPMEGFSAGGAPGSPSAADRMVIRNANLSIVVKDPAVTMDFIAKLAESSGGWVVTSNLYKTYTSDGLEVPQANITIRVPDGDLNDALEQIKSQVENKETDVRSENVSGEDVTATYTDLSSRRRNLEEAEKQLVEIMKNAYKTEDVLSVFNQLTQIRSEIEVLAGQMRYYEESAAYSAIAVEVVAQETVKPVSVLGWQPVGVMRDAFQALINTGKTLVNVLIWLIIFVLPILVILYLFVRLVIWIVKKLFFNKKKIAKETTTLPAELKK
jgi:5-bromo-4-chloroindolyl phosphate hydrolysis protein